MTGNKMIVDKERHIAALEHPRRRVDIVIDSDAYNEIDDQFAIAYALTSAEHMTVKAIYAAPFHNNRSNGPADGMMKSYDEILRLLDRMSLSVNGFVFKGSNRYLDVRNEPVPSAAVTDLIERSTEYSSENRLYVLAIGAITNIASALIVDPTLIDRIVVVWLGGHALYWPHAIEFNLKQDTNSAAVVFDSGVPVMLVPCLPVASHTLTTRAELEHALDTDQALSALLLQRFVEHVGESYTMAKEIWDVVPFGWLVNETWAPSHLDHSPVVQPDARYSIDRRRHLIRVVDRVNRNSIFDDMFRKLRTRVTTTG